MVMAGARLPTDETDVMTRQGTILIVDDELDSAIVMAVRRRLDEEGWDPVVVRPEGNWSTADEFEDAALYAIEESQPDGVLLDVRFGDQAEDRFKGLDILQSIVEQFPKLQIVGPNSLYRRDRPMQDMIQPVVGSCALDGLDVERLFDHTDDRPVALFTVADCAGVSVGDVVTDAAEERIGF